MSKCADAYKVMLLIINTGCSPEYAEYVISRKAKHWVVENNTKARKTVVRFLFGLSAYEESLRPGLIRYNYKIK